ncbi:DUF982 domain-containing protein [Chelatococcus sp. SYSU_G07232]|uniref:DUF982 domain-containing protein n=1 Tax=Chelatococcus albus TaxID=3047466 RepID=A0ABT7AM58_9HYPH|nr:DUF982 domain-containing protein [Chelatococcus sp. SYSU_G07232]MDJ1159879.1 DUF982 domain-containing protein [Chelatococcus sp. SYSU_G07232]
MSAHGYFADLLTVIIDGMVYEIGSPRDAYALLTSEHWPLHGRILPPTGECHPLHRDACAACRDALEGPTAEIMSKCREAFLSAALAAGLHVRLARVREPAGYACAGATA